MEWGGWWGVFGDSVAGFGLEDAKDALEVRLALWFIDIRDGAARSTELRAGWAKGLAGQRQQRQQQCRGQRTDRFCTSALGFAWWRDCRGLCLPGAHHAGRMAEPWAASNQRTGWRGNLNLRQIPARRLDGTAMSLFPRRKPVVRASCSRDFQSRSRRQRSTRHCARTVESLCGALHASDHVPLAGGIVSCATGASV